MMKNCNWIEIGDTFLHDDEVIDVSEQFIYTNHENRHRLSGKSNRISIEEHSTQ